MPALRQRERREHADRVERDQRVGDAAERDEQRGRRAGQHDDAVREHEPVAAVRELARQVAVLGDDRREAREAVVRGVRGEHQDRRGRELQEHEERPVAEHRPGRAARSPCGRGSGTAASWCASTETPKNSVPSSTPIHTSVVAAFFDSGRRNAGTPFEIASTPVSATAPDEKPFSRRKSAERAADSRASRRTLRRRTAPGRCRRRTTATSPYDDQRAEDQHVDVGRDGEDAARLLDPAHVQQRDQHDERRRRARTRCVGEARELGDRDDRGDAGRDRHRDGEHVVDHQRRAGDERRASRRCSPCSRRRRRRRSGRRRSPGGTRRSRSRAGRATTIAIGTSLLSPSARLDAPTAMTKRISSVAYAVDDSASEENTASAIVLESRCSSIWVEASGRPTNNRFKRLEHRSPHLTSAAACHLTCRAAASADGYSCRDSVARRSPARPGRRSPSRCRAGRRARPRRPAPRASPRPRDRRSARAGRPARPRSSTGSSTPSSGSVNPPSSQWCSSPVDRAAALEARDHPA